jgi:hypothetical protein
MKAKSSFFSSQKTKMAAFVERNSHSQPNRIGISPDFYRRVRVVGGFRELLTSICIRQQKAFVHDCLPRAVFLDRLSLKQGSVYRGWKHWLFPRAG